MSDLPQSVTLPGGTFELRLLAAGDLDAIRTFAGRVNEHDILFLGRDLKHPKVQQAWANALEEGGMQSLGAFSGGELAGTSAIVRDLLGWSPHVAEIRLIVGEDWRGSGLGRALLQASCDLAVASGAEKLIARMTPDQQGAIAMFEDSGFRGEALLRDHVRDRAGQRYDLAIFSLDVARETAHRRAYGFTDA